MSQGSIFYIKVSVCQLALLHRLHIALRTTQGLVHRPQIVSISNDELIYAASILLYCFIHRRLGLLRFGKQLLAMSLSLRHLLTLLLSKSVRHLPWRRGRLTLDLLRLLRRLNRLLGASSLRTLPLLASDRIPSRFLSSCTSLRPPGPAGFLGGGRQCCGPGGDLSLPHFLLWLLIAPFQLFLQVLLDDVVDLLLAERAVPRGQYRLVVRHLALLVQRAASRSSSRLDDLLLLSLIASLCH